MLSSRALLLTCALATQLCVRSQSVDTISVRAEMITVDDGLPQGLVWSIVQDDQGFLWFATKDGLTRYDGYEYRVFRNIPGDTTSLAGDHITALHVDRKGILWVGSERNGIHRYDPSTGLFQRIRRDRSMPAISGVVSMKEDASGDLWVHEFSGELCVLKDAMNAQVKAELNTARVLHPELDLSSLRDMRITSNGDLWLLDKEELTVWRREGAHFAERLRWRVPWPWIATESTPGLLYHRNKGRMLLVWERNTVVFDAATGAVVEEFKLPALQLRGSGMLIDERDRLWGQAPAGSWFRKDLNSGGMEFLRPRLEGGRAIPGTGFFSWTMDRSGIVWTGTPGYGLVKYRSRTERFHRYTFTDSPIRCAALVASDVECNELLVQFDLQVLHPDRPPLAQLPLIGALRKQGIEPTWGVCTRDEAGQYWVVGSVNGSPSSVYRFESRAGLLHRMTNDASVDHALVFPGLGPDVWLISGDSDRPDIERLTRIDSRTGVLAQVFRFPGRVRSGNYREIACWRIANDSTIWMATGNGVYGLHPGSGTWHHYTHVEGDNSTLPSNETFSLCFDPDEPDRYLWVGTEGKGLVRMDMYTGACDRSFTTAQGLPNDVVYGILHDARHNLWISTNQGLCCYDPRTGEQKTYTKADGIAGNEFNRYSAERAADGTLFFGGMEGITWFDPEQFHGRGTASPTLITRLKLLNKAVTVTDHQDLLPFPIHSIKELTLPYSERMITLEFANMDHSVPGQNEFRYMLEGLNEHWILNGNAHDATFTNLDPGAYTFTVHGRNSEGVWDEQGAVLHLFITPPWHATWWFRTLLVIIGMAILYGLYRYRVSRALELASVRDRIARDLHDEIGSTLSSVALFSEVAIREHGPVTDGRSTMLRRISESTSQMLESMNDIVWAVNSRNDDLLHVAQRMQEFAARVSEAVGFELGFRADALDGRKPLSMVKRKNLYLVFKEAVNNAAKYSGCSRLTVDVRKDQGWIVLRVSDNGTGFASAHVNGSGGNGLGNMRIRAKEMDGEVLIRSTPGEGTLIELRFRP